MNEMMNKLTTRQMREVQTVLGLTINEFDQDPLGVQAALAWIVKRETDKDFTFDMALDLPMVELAEILGISVDETDPKVA